MFKAPVKSHATGFWKQLQQRAKNGELDLSSVTFVNPDEWIGLGDGHPESYSEYLARQLTDHFETKILVPDGNASDPVAAAGEVEQDELVGLEPGHRDLPAAAE